MSDSNHSLKLQSKDNNAIIVYTDNIILNSFIIQTLKIIVMYKHNAGSTNLSGWGVFSYIKQNTRSLR